MIKNFKKSSGDEKKLGWFVDMEQLKEIKKLMSEKGYEINIATLDDLVPILHFLGYVEYEKEN